MNEMITVDLDSLERDFKGAITVLEQQMKRAAESGAVQPLDLPPVHRFCDGLYCRELFMPAGSIVVSRVHKHDNIAIISKGDVSVYTEHGLERITAPHCRVTGPGTKRLLYNHEDTIWTTVHPLPEGMNQDTPIEEVEAFFACDTLEDYQQYLLAAHGGKELDE